MVAAEPSDRQHTITGGVEGVLMSCMAVVVGEGGVLIIMHGRSRMTVDPRIPAMPGRSMTGFHRPGQHR